MTKLESMLKYVSEHNDFYKKRIKEYGIKDPLDITQWPVLTRKELQENRYNMFSDGYREKYFEQRLHRQSSSGSSGVPVNVYWDYKDWYASIMTIWRKRLLWYNIHSTDKCVVFTLNAFKVIADGETVFYTNEVPSILSVNVSLIHSEQQYIKLICIINDFNPAWMYVQPFVLNRLIQTWKKYNLLLPSNLRYIECVGEMLSVDLRKISNDYFNIPIASLYGSEEMNGIAFECKENHMHVLDDNVLLEVQNKSGILSCGEGEAIITNLNNIAMPLIRYNQGDIISLKKAESTCDIRYGSLIIDVIKGRESENIVLPSGSELNAALLSEIIAEVNNQFNGAIIEYSYQYIKSKQILTCNICIETKKREWYYAIEKAIKKTIIDKIYLLNDLHFQVLQTEEFYERSDKRQILTIKE